jgi:hypothetical protein
VALLPEKVLPATVSVQLLNVAPPSLVALLPENVLSVTVSVPLLSQETAPPRVALLLENVPFVTFTLLP